MLMLRGSIVLGFCIAVATAFSAGKATERLRLFEVTTEIGMPHLEENLRYATTREKQCLSDEQLFHRFPVLDHVALSDCTLVPESRQSETAVYRLACSGGHGTTGAAVWRIGENRLQGTLTVKLGGKNMTFYQRVTALPLGECGDGVILRTAPPYRPTERSAVELPVCIKLVAAAGFEPAANAL